MRWLPTTPRLRERATGGPVHAGRDRVRPVGPIAAPAGTGRLRGTAESGATCEKLRISPDQIADRIESIIGAARRLDELAMRGRITLPAGSGLGLSSDGKRGAIVVDDRFRVMQRQSCGAQECPFEDAAGDRCEDTDPDHASVDLRIENLRHREHSTRSRPSSSSHPPALELPGLIIHLIRDHHFFEGSVPYRVDPAHAADVLEIEPGIDYRPRRATEKAWYPTFREIKPEESLEPWGQPLYFGSEPADAVIDVLDGVRVYIEDDVCAVVADRDHRLEGPLVVRDAEWYEPVIRRGTWLYHMAETSHVVP